MTAILGIVSSSRRVALYKYLAVVNNGAQPQVIVYPFSDLGFGTKFSNPSTQPQSAAGVSWTQGATSIAVAQNTSGGGAISGLISYSFSASGFGTNYSPANEANFEGTGVAFRSDGTQIVKSQRFSPYVVGYPYSGSGFGSRYSNPATAVGNEALGVAISPNNLSVAVAHSTGANVSVYAFSGSGFGTKYSDPSTLPTGSGRSVAFSQDSKNIAVAHDTTPFISVYPWSSGFGTKYSNPATLPGSDSTGVAFG